MGDWSKPHGNRDRVAGDGISGRGRTGHVANSAGRRCSAPPPKGCGVATTKGSPTPGAAIFGRARQYECGSNLRNRGLDENRLSPQNPLSGL